MTMKTKKTLQHIASVAVVLLAFCLVFVAPVAASTWTDAGNFNATWFDAEGGTDASEYHIYDAASLAALAEKTSVNASKYAFSGKTIYLEANVDLLEHEWMPIGGNFYNSFRGTFDGKNHVITNLTVNSNCEAGLFGGIVNGAVSSLTIDGAKVTSTGSDWYHGVGALVGYVFTEGGETSISDIIIKNSTIESASTFEKDFVGGIGGVLYIDELSNCQVINCEISGSSASTHDETSAGGIAGMVCISSGRSGTVSSCTVAETTISGFKNVGGLIGAGWAFDSLEIGSSTVSATTINADEATGVVSPFVGELTILSGEHTPVSITLLGGNSVTNVKVTDAEGVTNTYTGNIVSLDSEDLDGVAQINGIQYFTLEEAVAAATDGQTVTLLKDVILDETLTISAEKKITLDLAGHSISGQNSAVDEYNVYTMILNQGDLTIIDSSQAKNGKIIYSQTNAGDGESGYDYTYDCLRNRGTLTISGGTIEVVSTSEVLDNSVVYAIDVSNGAAIINGGKVIHNNYSAIRVEGAHTNPPTLTIDGGEITGAVEFQNPGRNAELGDGQSAALMINDGTITKNAKFTYALRFINFGADQSNMKILISGGTLNGEFNERNIGDAVGTLKDVLTIKGGTFSSNPSAYIASGYEVVQPGDKYLVQVYVDRSSSSSSVKPEEPEQPEEPVVEPETPAAPGEVASSTEVTDGGDVTFETPAGEDGTAPAAADDEVKGVVLPTGTEGTVEFVPVSEQPAPAGQEENTKRVFEINVPSYKKGEASVIKFQMTVAEIEADGKTAADVALWHYDEETGEWTKLVTSFIIKDGIVYFEAITNDFSPFAIIYADEPAADLPTDTPETPEQPEEPASPAPVLAVLAALGAAVVLRRK